MNDEERAAFLTRYCPACGKQSITARWENAGTPGKPDWAPIAVHCKRPGCLKSRPEDWSVTDLPLESEPGI